MQPIATYRETRLEGRRTLLLLPDRLNMSSSGIAGETNLSLDLSTLSPVVGRMRVRSRYFVIGLGVLALALVTVVIGALNIKDGSSFIAFPSGIIIVGFIIMAVSFRCTEYARFTSLSGVAVLDIARSGPDSANFDAFVEAVVRQIQANRQAV